MYLEKGVISTLATASTPWVGAALVCALLTSASLVQRWRLLLGVYRDNPPLRWTALTWARSQVINLLPLSQLGGDIYRISASGRRIGNTPAAAAIVASERLLGLVALGSLALIGLMAKHNPVFCVVGLVGSFVLIRSLLFLYVRPSALPRRSDSMNQSIMAGARRPRVIREFLAFVVSISNKPQVGHGALALSMLAHLSTTLIFLCADRAIGLDTPLTSYLIAVPLSNLVLCLPFHIAGLGVLEGSLWYFLSWFTHRSMAEVVAVCVVTRIQGLAWMAVMALSFAVCTNALPQTPAPLLLTLSGRK